MIKTHLKRILVGCVLGLAAALVSFKTTPRVYEGDAQVFINSSGGGKATADMTALLSLGLSQGAATEGALLRSPGTFKQALLNVASRDNIPSLTTPEMTDALYLMYDIEMLRGSRMMTIKVRAYSPKVAADIANEVVEVYNNKRRQTSSSAFTNAQDSIKDQLASTKRDLEKTEERIKRFQELNRLVNISTTTAQITSYQNTLAQQLDAAKTEEATTIKSIEATKVKIAQLPKTVETELSLVKSPILASIEMEIANYEKQRTELLRLYTPTSTKIRDLDEIVARTRERQLEAQKGIWQKVNRTFQIEPIRAGFEQQLASSQISLVSLRARQRSIGRELGTQNALAATLPAKERQMAELQRDRAIFQSKYTRLKDQTEELRLQSATNFLPAVNLYAATPNGKIVTPQAGKTLPMGLMAGGILGLLFSLARESMRSTARTSSEISDLFELPVVATVPSLPPTAVRKRLESYADPKYVPMESFRFMASAAALMSNGPRRVLFTSVGGNVGCSSAAGEFAIAAARMGIRTLLVDADLTFGTLSKAFKVADKPGLRDVLDRTLLGSGDHQVGLPTEHRYLSILPVGAGTDTSAILDSPPSVLEGVLTELQESVDLIVIDGPPIDVVADSSRFVSTVQEVYLVVSARKTSLQAISLSRGLLARCGAGAVSVILTGTAQKQEAFTDFSRYSLGRR